jgi:predicted nucleic acid-binding Zn ribbon protein
MANAALRQAAFADLGEQRAHQLSTVTLLLFLAAYMWAVQQWRELPSARTALQVGRIWAGLTVVL